MEEICIETENTNPEMFRRRLLQQIDSWRNSGLLQEFQETSTGTITVWDCKTSDNYQAKNFRRLAAQVIAEHIVSEVEPVLLKRLMNLHHPHLGKEEAKIICDKVRQRLNREELLTGESRYQQILKCIEDFLRERDQINIEGFLRFRLQDYQRNLLTLINQSADDYMIEKEYQDFIDLLKYFVEIQQPRFSEMHLMRQDKSFVLCDPDFKVVHREKVRDLEGADAIISTLVTAAPSQVTIHLASLDEDDELVTTIQSIFDSRVHICLGCEQCAKE